jgi:glutamate racemase
VTQACVGLVECIERGELNASNTRNLIQQYCAPLLAEGADTIVLGCTHYPFVRDVIAEIVGKEVVLIDTGAAVANQLKHRLELENMQSAQLQDALPKKPKVQFWTNSSADNAKQVISQLWGESANVLVF